MITDVNIAEDCVTEDDAVFELCVERGGVGLYIRLSRWSGFLAAGCGTSGSPVSSISE